MQYKSIKELFTAIADKIRAKEGWSGNIPSQDIPMAIDLACQQQYDNGWNEGESEGRQSGYENGFEVGYTEGEIVGREQGKEQGKTEVYSEIEPINAQLENTLNGTDTGGKSYYDEFWDNFQDYGNRTNYQYGAFGGIGWTDKTYKPKYPLKPKHAYQMYAGCRLTEILNVDTSDAQSIGQMFYVCEIVKRVGVISTESITGSNGFVNTFSLCSKLQTIDKLILKDSITFNGSFSNCASLENLTIEGTIGQDGFNGQWSTKLSKASIISIINALSTTASGKSVTLSKVAVKSAFGSTESEEWISLIAARSNWTINLV